eukprot:TRINITY_DN96178_c0_g1_i1.p1 TRINITY_DN96178_c0_g1~~TRINITY_DN96178_c0_g1_i1.p1  ORF type:complete len:403 (+),score=84.91 TRINITY_DN96178_c0_g1_i1:37-1209(+)
MALVALGRTLVPQASLPFAGNGRRGFARRLDGYLHYYGMLKNQEGMLRDRPRVEGYRKALEKLAPRLQGATVMDIGSGSGILAFFAARYGAKKVYAIEASPEMARVASRLARANSLVGTVEVVPKHLEDVTEEDIPAGSVDVIVSELFSHYLVGEVGLQVVTHAKQRFLKDGGLVLPGLARLRLSPFQDRALGAELRERHSFWRSTDFHGFDLSAVLPIAEEQALRQNVIDIVDPSSLLVPPAESPFHELDLAGPDDPEAWRAIQFEVTFPVRHRDAVVDGVCGWWDIEFAGVGEGDKSVLSTAPDAPPTVWAQCRFLLDRPMAVEATARLTCSCEMKVHEARESYSLRLELRNHTTGAVSRAGPIELSNVYARHSAAALHFDEGGPLAL